MVWPAIAAAAIGAAGSMIGGAQQGSNSRSVAREANRINQDMQIREMQFNAGQANADRQWNHEQANYARAWESEQAMINRDWNAGQAQENRNFQRFMSDTQYQRTIQDMKNAGINPMLAVSQGGAGNVGGSTASSQAPSVGAAQGSRASIGSGSGAAMPQFQNWLGMGVSSGMQTYQSLIAAEQSEAATAESKARALVHIAEVQRVQSQTDLNSAERAKVQQAVDRLMYEWDQGFFQRSAAEDVQQKISATNRGISESHTAAEGAKQARQATRFQELEFPRRSGEAQFHQMLNDALKGGASSASGLKDLFIRGLGASRYLGGK